jgi:hypothetical protein
MHVQRNLLVSLVILFVLLTLLGVASTSWAVPVVASQVHSPVGPEPGSFVMMQETNNLRLVLPEAAFVQQPAAAAMTQGFEATWPAAGWQIGDGSSTDGGEYTWGKRNCHPHAGTYSAWAIGGGAQGSALACGSNYPNNANAQAAYGPFDLSNATAASLTFHVWGKSQMQGDSCADYLFAGSFTNDTDLDGKIWCGDATGGSAGNSYYRITLDLSDRAGASRVWILFAFVSDSSVTYQGFTIDDVTLDVSGSAPGGSGKVYLPLVAREEAPPSTPEPPSGSAFEQVKRSLTTQGAGTIFGFDADRCTFDSATMDAYFGPFPCGTPLPQPRSEAERQLRKDIQTISFRAGYNLIKADLEGTSLLTDAAFESPDPNRLRISFTQGTSISFRGDLAQNEMQVTFSKSVGNAYQEQCNFYRVDGQFRCPVTVVPQSEWSPAPVSNVVIRELSNRCIRVSWQPAPTNVPGAAPAEYSLRLDTGGAYRNDIRAPGNVSTYDDCSDVATRSWYCGDFQDTVFVIGSNGKTSNPTISNVLYVCRF